jgi:hypothetical protein
LKILVTVAMFTALQAMANEPTLPLHVADATAIAMTAYRSSEPIDHHVASVLAAYAAKQASFTQDRYGK